jgi:predicted Zn-dependent protease
VGEELGQVTGAFKDSIGDITKTMISSGYSKSAEFDADLKAAKVLDAAGYDPRALERVLRAMEKKLDPKAKDFSKTHPKPADRINVLKKTLDALKVKASAPTAARSERFAVAMKNL